MGRGRPPYEPSEKDRRTVRAMVAYGVPLEDVSKVVGVDRKTLSKHFEHEIETAATEANAKVAEALYRQAVDNGNTTAQIFWLKTKAGWRETQKFEHFSPDGTGLFGQFFRGVQGAHDVETLPPGAEDALNGESEGTD